MDKRCEKCKKWTRVTKLEGKCAGADTPNVFTSKNGNCDKFLPIDGYNETFIKVVEKAGLTPQEEAKVVEHSCHVNPHTLEMIDKGTMEIINTRVYGLEESLIASGYPMQKTEVINMLNVELGERAYKRGMHLGKAKTGSGHDCYLKGVIVQMDIKAPEYWWRQFDRYHFRDYVSSQSKMHKILEFDVNEVCNMYVSHETIKRLNETIRLYNEFDETVAEGRWIQLRNGVKVPYTKKNIFKVIVANIPAGLTLTARITTNYLQLKSIKAQRKGHKLQEWHSFIAWVDVLPAFLELTEGKKAEDK